MNDGYRPDIFFIFLPVYQAIYEKAGNDEGCIKPGSPKVIAKH